MHVLELTDEQEKLFPLINEENVFHFLKLHFEQARDAEVEPNLSLISIVLGYVEHELTQSKLLSDQSSSAESEQEGIKNNATPKEKDKPIGKDDTFPQINLNIIKPLYFKFKILIQGTFDKSLTEHTTRSGLATREACQKLCDVLWNRLFPNYHKDKPHIQSLFSFLTNRQLDCFGLAFAVVCAAQLLNYTDVHLVLSEDHAWLLHGDNEMTEVTWHGKGNEDKRGNPITENIMAKNWVYSNGKALKCDRWTEVAAMITAINPSIDLHTESEEMGRIHHFLLRLMYSYGSLEKYPMALSLLGNYENDSILPESSLPSASKLFEKSINCVKENYDNLHILPYCSQALFYLKEEKGLLAIKYWADASDVLSRYNYTREDEEIYKEFREIASDLIPQALKFPMSYADGKEAFKEVARFYDGVCLWEEGSNVPVLHSWWAKYFTTAMAKFSANVRAAYKRDTSSESEDGVNKPQPNNLGMKSEKMIGLSGVICREKINTQAVGLQLTAQSQVNFEKRKSNVGDYSIDYSTKAKRKRKIRSFDF